MPTVVQFRRGNTVQNNNFTGADGEISIDTTLHVLRVADGSTTGGFALVGATAEQTITNKIYQGTSVSVTGNVAGDYIIGNGSLLTGLPAGYSNSDVATYLSSGTVSTDIKTTAAISATGTVTGESLTVGTGTITGGNIVNSNASGIGNIGSSTTYFNTVFAKATSAQYADLAEMYSADENYHPGTVVEFGGIAEVTISSESHSTRVAGIVSTNPSYLMNSALDCEYALEIALTGRVPCQVVGTIRKGDRLVASNLPGVATALDMQQYQPGCIIGKALEDYDSIATGVIEVAVGRT